jgi:hypothetical protein
MNKMLSTLTVALSLMVAAESSAQAIEPLPRDLEMELAATALPPHLRENSTIYILDPEKGFEVARKGTNGFHALVARTGDDTFRGSWPFTKYRDDILYPVSFDSAGVTSHMRVFFDAAEMQAKGTPPQELKKTIQDRFKSGHYKAPERAGLSYMLAPIQRTYDDPEKHDKVSTASHPHVMHYAPNVSQEDIGGGELGGTYPHIIMPGPHGLVIQALGKTEQAAIRKDHPELLRRLCEIKDLWCLPKEQTHH